MENPEALAYLQNFKNKCILTDNIEQHTVDIPPREEFCMPHFNQLIYIQHGTLRIKVNSVKMQLTSHDCLEIGPQSNIIIERSKCKFFSFVMRANLVYQVNRELSIPLDLRDNAYCFHHYHLSAAQFQRMREIYEIAKREMDRPVYPMKEIALLAIARMHQSTFHHFVRNMTQVDIHPNNLQYKQFLKFLDRLETNFRHHRSVQFYASCIGVTPKYLSAITLSFTRKPASSVIDNYIAFRIKLMLCQRETTVKQISETLDFPTQSFFGRYFKRITGLSPREYINRFAKNLLDSVEDADSSYFSPQLKG